MKKDKFDKLREEMVSRHIASRGITNQRILEAFRSVPRHLFVPKDRETLAYSDRPLPIGQDQTISQPYIVALMTDALGPKEGEKVLEVGTGSGYQAAILAAIGTQVYGLERLGSLAEKAKTKLKSLGYDIKMKVGDGTLGWEEYSPYDKIIVTAAAPALPEPLVEQLKTGGKMVIPIGQRYHQDLTLITKLNKDKITEEKICGCIFVPLIGQKGWS